MDSCSEKWNLQCIDNDMVGGVIPPPFFYNQKQSDMLYINNKYLNLDAKVSGDEFDAIRKDFHKKIRDLKDRFGDYVSLKSRKVPVRNPSGLLEPWKVITLPLKQVVAGANGSEEWVYTSSVPLVKDGYVVPDSLQEIIRNGELKISLDKDPDKAYFFLYKHEFVKNGTLILEDVKSDEEKKALARKREAKLNFIIYDDASSLNTDEEKLKVIARRWGVFNVDGLTPAQIKNRLYDVVIESDRNSLKDNKFRTIQDFVSDCEVDNTVKVGAIIQEAMDEGYLFFDDNTRQWKIDYKDGGHKPVLLAVSSNEVKNKREVLIANLIMDSKALSVVENVLGKELGAYASPVLDKEYVERIDNIQLLRKHAKSLGINSFGKNAESIRKEILEKLEETV